MMNTLDRESAVTLIRQSGGLFFHAVFVKRDGTLRAMNCRYGPDHTISAPPRDEKPGLIVVKDTGVNAWRTLPVDGLRELHIRGQLLQVL